MSAKDRLRTYLREHVGEIVTSNELHDVAGITEWARRLRELRDEEQWPIRSHHDLASLKPNQYILESLPPDTPNVTFRRTISAKVKSEVLDRNGFTCQMCGLTPGDTVLDSFMGTGTTLIAAHNLGRTAHGIELSPIWCDVIAARFEAHTAVTPTRDGIPHSFQET